MAQLQLVVLVVLVMTFLFLLAARHSLRLAVEVVVEQLVALEVLPLAALEVLKHLAHQHQATQVAVVEVLVKAAH
jgi:hypothetical protein